ncbi:hypothetical protein F5141DRAFT_1089736 [Pisolithus sp. B1]|nr:hypothetical protein F5141DRAFT_1089736 [Pisolithus sp. B1]
MQLVSMTSFLYLLCKVGKGKGVSPSSSILAVLGRPCSPPACSLGTDDYKCEYLRHGGCSLRRVCRPSQARRRIPEVCCDLHQVHPREHRVQSSDACARH